MGSSDDYHLAVEKMHASLKRRLEVAQDLEAVDEAPNLVGAPGGVVRTYTIEDILEDFETLFGFKD